MVIKMYGSEREREILNLLGESEYATVDYLAKRIHISPSSIRRDLKRLELKGLVTRSYGGAEINKSSNRQIPFFLRQHKNTKEKAIAAKKAASLVKPGNVIFIDSSTSTYFMIEYLKNTKDITVITNGLSAMALCAEHGIDAFFAGGRLSRENRTCCTGAYTEEFISSIHADFCFFSVQSVAKDGMLYDCFSDEIKPRSEMLKNSEKKVFLCDGSKINHYSAYKLCNIGELDFVICDIDLAEYLDSEYPHVTFISGE